MGKEIDYLFELIKRTISGDNSILYSAISLASTMRGQAVPIEGVIPDLCRVVEEWTGGC